MDRIKALAFDTGGTILDWHSGIVAALSEAGARRGVAADWHVVANAYRRRSLARMLGAVDPDFTIDDVHRSVLDEILAAHGAAALTSKSTGSVRISCPLSTACGRGSSASRSRS